jgi:hypothetical protein
MSKVFLGWLLALFATGAAAQSGVTVGTAAAGFGTGVTVARDADAVFWNPALVGLQPFSDVRTAPGGSVRFMSISVPRAAARDWVVDGSSLGLLGGGPSEAPGWTRLVSPGGADVGGEVNVVWISSATGSLALAVSSHAEANGSLAGTSTDTVGRSASTVAMLAVAGAAGEILGMRARVGATIKGRWVHLIGSGYRTDGGSYREMLLRDIPGAGADVGVVLQPGGFVISGVLSDLVSLTYRPRGGARIRTVTIDDAGAPRETESAAVDDGSSQTDRAAAEKVYRDAVAPIVARLGIARSGSWGEMAVSVEHRVKMGGLHDVPASAWSASWRLPFDRVPVRIGTTRGSESAGWEIGWVGQSCSFPWSASLGRARSAGNAEATTAFSFALGWRSARSCGRVR